MLRRRARRALVGAAAACVVAALAGCGGATKTKTVVVAPSTPAATQATTTSATTPTATQASPSSAGPQPALSGTYSVTTQPDSPSLQSTASLPDNPHDGIQNADKQWVALSGACTAQACTVQLRRVLSDATLETLVMHSDSPTGVYQGAIPGGDGNATNCSNGGGRRRSSFAC